MSVSYLNSCLISLITCFGFSSCCLTILICIVHCFGFNSDYISVFDLNWCFYLINYLFWLQLMSPPWFYYLLFFILTALVSTRIAYPFDFNSCQRGCPSVLISITALDVPSAPKLFRLQYGFNMSYKIFHWLIMINNGKALLLSCLHDQLSSHDSHINVDRN